MLIFIATWLSLYALHHVCKAGVAFYEHKFGRVPAWVQVFHLTWAAINFMTAVFVLRYMA
jgi:hypothetical protein